MWHTKWFRELLSAEGVVHVDFHTCMHGGSRKKASTWITNIMEFLPLVVKCDGSHEHEPWGIIQEDGNNRFATADDAAYPDLLCKRVAAAIVKRAASLSIPSSCVQCPDTGPAQPPNKEAMRRAAAGKQPREKRYPELIPEFARRVSLDFSCDQWAKWQYVKGSKPSKEFCINMGHAVV